MKRPLIYLCGLIVGGLSCFVLPDYLPDSVAIQLPAVIGGFFLFFFSMCLLVASVLRQADPDPSLVEASIWDITRAKGKPAWVKRFVVIGFLPCLGIVVMLGVLQSVNYGFAWELAIFLVFIFVVCLLSLVGVARLLWDANEKRTEAFRSKDSSQ